VSLINEDQGRGVNRRVYSHAYVKSLEVIRVEKIPFFFFLHDHQKGEGRRGRDGKARDAERYTRSIMYDPQ
jgi:hypothetical protein